MPINKCTWIYAVKTLQVKKNNKITSCLQDKYSLWSKREECFARLIVSLFSQAGIALGDLRSVGDLYDFQSIATLFFIGVISITPTLMGKSES